jgi:integrase/recombinase XerD
MSTTAGLTPQYQTMIDKTKGNKTVISDYITTMQTEVNLSDNYRKSIIKITFMLSRHHDNKPFKSMTRQDIISYLNSVKKPESVDPMHKWIGTYNFYNTILTKFFKWLYNPDMTPKSRLKPNVIENIPQLKRKEISCYKPTDLWTEQDDAIFLKYCPHKRIKCYHTVARDMSARPDEILKLKCGEVVFKRKGDKQYAEIVVNGKTGSRSIPLFNSIPYVKDYLEHEHPQPNNLNAAFICGLQKGLGRRISVSTLESKYVYYKQVYFPKLLLDPGVPQEDKDIITPMLRKPWNPYIRRHTGLTEKAPKIPGMMNQYAGWTEGSKMPQKYLHYFGNESSNELLQAYGILPKDQEESDTLKPKQCPQCKDPNKPDSKFCGKCGMVLTYDGYQETVQEQQNMKKKMEDMAKAMYEAGILKKD